MAGGKGMNTGTDRGRDGLLQDRLVRLWKRAVSENRIDTANPVPPVYQTAESGCGEVRSSFRILRVEQHITSALPYHQAT